MNELFDGSIESFMDGYDVMADETAVTDLKELSSHAASFLMDGSDWERNHSKWHSESAKDGVAQIVMQSILKFLKQQGHPVVDIVELEDMLEDDDVLGDFYMEALVDAFGIVAQELSENAPVMLR
jgi:hypothetical protein